MFAVLFNQDEHYYPSYFDGTLTGSQANGFDADSEGSDYEIVPNVNANRNSEPKINMNLHVSTSPDANGNPMPSTIAITAAATMATPINDVKKVVPASSPVKQSAALKRSHKAADTSKFNRSNRESDHLATYYFRHPDTEPESGTNNGTGGDCSSQDATSDVYSEDDQWFYTNGNDGNENADGNPAFTANSAQHEINGNESQNFDLTCVSMRVNCSDVIVVADEVDSPTANGLVSSARELLFVFFLLFPMFAFSPLPQNGSTAHVSYEAAQKKSYTLVSSRHKKSIGTMFSNKIVFFSISSNVQRNRFSNWCWEPRL